MGGEDVRKLRVLHILNTDSFSGAENVVINIINNGEEKIEGMYVSKDGSIRNVLEEESIQFYPLCKLNLRNVKRVICETKPDIIHAHDFRAGIIAACSTSKIPIINHLHNNSPWLGSFNFKSFFWGIVATRYKKILTVSDSVMKEFLFGSFFEKKTQIVGNPIELSKVIKKAGEHYDGLSYDIAFLGRLTEQKNPLFFLEIVNELRNKIPSLKVAIIGEGELRQDVERRIAELQLEDTIKLYGFLNNPYPVLNMCKVLCMPSKWEGFGLAAVEALTLGKPVFASPVGGLVNIVNSECGDLCTTQSDYVLALESILSDETYYNEKSQKAFERAEELENMDKYMNKLSKIYFEVIQDGENK